MESTTPKYCDVIMKGGTASAIVYPPLLATLAKTFRLRNLAGTSAGSIGAALGAAAEYQRLTTGSQAGYERLDSFADLVDEAGGILPRFRPTEAAAPAWQAFWALRQQRGPRLWLSLWSAFAGDLLAGFAWGALCALLLAAPTLAWGWPGLVGTLLAMAVAAKGGRWVVAVSALALVAAGPRLMISWGLVGFLTLGAVVGAAAGWLHHLWRLWTRVLPEQGFALCRGGELTEWLHSEMQAAAGRAVTDKPLTFGDYQGCRYEDGGTAQLRMMTTCLSQRRPYTLPFATQALWFEPEALAPLVGPSLAAALVAASPGEPVRVGSRELRRLPDDLPVALGMRLSMALPMVLSAVPLWTRRPVNTAPRGEAPNWTLEWSVLWFADGGMTSNLPLHLFDAMVPRWPTVAINLDYATDPADPGDVWLVSGNRAGQQPRWYGLSGMTSFVLGLVETARNWQDSTQMTVPGQRDRLAHLRLRTDQGSMNLDMDLPTMRDVADKARQAARLLAARFGDDAGRPSSEWANHRWIRLLNASKLLEGALEQYQGAETAAPSYDELLEAPLPHPYDGCVAAARLSVEALRAQAPATALRDCAATPKPECELRIRPKL